MEEQRHEGDLEDEVDQTAASFGQGGKDTVRESGLKNPLYVLQSPTADNVGSDFDEEAIKWAGLKAAVEILNA